MKAMILAAGRGERMQPLSNTTPKPLLKIGDHSLIEHQIIKLKQAGITDIVINISYLGQHIIQHLKDGSQFGVSIQYSDEKDNRLGTGGGIYQALSQLGSDPFLLLSADIYSDISLRPLLEKSITEKAHLVCVPNPSFHPKGDYALTATGLIYFGSPTYTFAGIAIFHPQLFHECQNNVFPLTDILTPAILKQRVSGEIYSGTWHNVGTPSLLAELNEKHNSTTQTHLNG